VAAARSTQRVAVFVSPTMNSCRGVMPAPMCVFVWGYSAWSRFTTVCSDAFAALSDTAGA